MSNKPQSPKPTTSAVDPIEAAKIAAQAPRVAAPEAKSGQAAKAPQSGPELSEKEPQEPKLGAPPAESPKVERFKVLRPITIMWGDQQLRLAADTLVSESSYGKDCVEKMKAQGVALEKVE